MNAPHPHFITDWKSVAESLAGIITELHPEYSNEVLAVVSHHTSAVMNTTQGANGAGKELQP